MKKITMFVLIGLICVFSAFAVGQIIMGDDSWIGNSASTERIVFDADGNDIELMGANVGIGIASPEQKLHVLSTGDQVSVFEGSNAARARIIINAAAGGTSDAQVNFLNDDATEWAIGFDDSDSDKFKIAHNNELSTSTAITIDESLNVGIGTATPAAKLELQNGGSFPSLLLTRNDVTISANNAMGRLSFGAPGANATGIISGTIVVEADDTWSAASKPTRMVFYVNPTGFAGDDSATATTELLLGLSIDKDGVVDAPIEITAGTKTFTIDNPEDPLNSKLRHVNTESPEALLTYRGQAETNPGHTGGFDNGNGWYYSTEVTKTNTVVITLPSWFDDLTRDGVNYQEYTGQVTGIKSFCGDAYFDFDDVDNNKITIVTEKACTLSWKVDAVRHDPFYESHKVNVVTAKDNYVPQSRVFNQTKDDGIYEITEYIRPTGDTVGFCIHDCDEYTQTTLPKTIEVKIAELPEPVELEG